MQLGHVYGGYPFFFSLINKKGEKMVKKIAFILIVLVLLLSKTTVALAEKPPEPGDNGNANGTGQDNGFEEGYNRTAHIFNGTYGEWCMEKIGNQDYCDATYGDWYNDKLIMKWNAEWDHGNEEGWSDDNYDAWLNNIGNGKGPGGSGESYLVKIVWVGDCPEGEILENGGYCIWGQFAVIMEKSSVNGELTWFVHNHQAGYGVWLQKPE